MDNGIVQVYLSNPGGFVTRIQYNGIDNLLEALNEKNNRGYITTNKLRLISLFPLIMQL